MLLVFADTTSIETDNCTLSESDILYVEATKYADGYLSSIFDDERKTNFMSLVDNDEVIGEYENFTAYKGIMHYKNGIKKVIVYKEDE